MNKEECEHCACRIKENITKTWGRLNHGIHMDPHQVVGYIPDMNAEDIRRNTVFMTALTKHGKDYVPALEDIKHKRWNEVKLKHGVHRIDGYYVGTAVRGVYPRLTEKAAKNTTIHFPEGDQPCQPVHVSVYRDGATYDFVIAPAIPRDPDTEKDTPEVARIEDKEV